MAPNQSNSASRSNITDSIALIERGRWIGRRLTGMFLGALILGGSAPIAGSMAVSKIQDMRHEVKVPDDIKFRDNALLVVFTASAFFGAAFFRRELKKLDGDYVPPSSGPK